MKFTVITLFPEMIEGPLRQSIVGKAFERQIASLACLQLRQYCDDKHLNVDDAPFGGGGGMVIKAGPVVRAVNHAKQDAPGARVIYLSPQGQRLDQAKVNALATSRQDLILLCGHYEGVDQRALDAVVDEELSIGDYVLTGGELAACVLIDAVTRQLPGALGDKDSATNDSFFQGLLDFPHFTRPEHSELGEVPEVLLSGHHARVQRWRRQEALTATLKKRPDLLECAPLTRDDREFLSGLGWLDEANKKKGNTP